MFLVPSCKLYKNNLQDKWFQNQLFEIDFFVMPDLPALARLAGKWQLHKYIYLQNFKTNLL
jgi:hypothetical protein